MFQSMLQVYQRTSLFTSRRFLCRCLNTFGTKLSTPPALIVVGVASRMDGILTHGGGFRGRCLLHERVQVRIHADSTSSIVQSSHNFAEFRVPPFFCIDF